MRVINFTFFVLLFLVNTAQASELPNKMENKYTSANPALAGHVCFDEQGTQITLEMGTRIHRMLLLVMMV